MNVPLIKLAHVSKYYKTKTGVSEGMRDVSLEFYNNQFVAITGESGSGKTTLLNVISGLDTYEDGELFYQGKETSHFSVKDFEKFRARNIGFVFQTYNVIDSYTVYDNIVIALIAQNYPKEQIKSRALELIEKVGLLSHKNQRTSKLSGGEKQRVVIARALAKDAPIILADEPTGNLDQKSSDEILSLLKEISQDRLVIMVSHNMAEVDKFATRKVIMKDGNVINDVLMEEKEITEANITEDLETKNSFNKGFNIGLKNILRTPKRTIFTLLLFSIVLFSFIYFYSMLIGNALGSIGTSFQSEFNIALVKRDETKFSKEEYDSFKVGKGTIKYFNVDFEDVEILPDDFEGEEYEKYDYLYEVKFAASIHSSSIKSGVKPASKYQVLLSEFPVHPTQYDIGSTIKVNGIDFEVVGFVREPNVWLRSDNIIYLHENFIYDNDFQIFEEAEPFVSGNPQFDSIVISGVDRQEVKLYKKGIDTNIYQIIDPNIIEEKNMEFIIGTFKVLFWIILLLILQLVFFVIYQIQKNVMESRKKDFSVYRSVGISEQEVSFMILFEQLIISLFAALIIGLLLLILSNQITFVYKITRNVTIFNYLFIVLIFVFFSLRLGQRFNKKIFNLTVIEALKEDN